MPRTTLAFGLLASMHAVLIVAITVILMGLPAMQRELRLTSADVVLLTAAYGLAFGGLLLLGGRLADLLGRRRVFRIGVGLFAIASVAAGFANGFVVLLVARFAQGLGAALTAPAAMALLGVLFPDSAQRARAVAVWGGLAGIGATLGTLLSGIVVTWASWRWTFAVPAAVAIVVSLAAPRLLPAGPPPIQTRLDVPGAILATAGLSTLSYGLVQVTDRSWTAPAIVPLVTGLLLLAAFLAVEARSRAPLLPIAFVARRPRLIGLLTALLTAAGYGTLQFLLSQYFLERRGFSPLETSMAFVPLGLAAISGGFVAGRVTARLGPRIATTIGLAIAAIGMLLLGRIGGDTAYSGPIVAGLLIFPLGASLAFSGATVAAVDDAPDHQTGLAGGLVNSAIEIGPTAGLALLVSLAATRTAWLTRAGTDLSEATTAGDAFALAAAGLAFVLTAGLAAFGLQRRGDGPSSAPTRGEA